MDVTPKVVNGYNESDVSRDILKITVVNRYEENATPSIGFIKNFGLRQGAIASSVGHDSHNIIAIGVDDEAMTTVVNALIDSKGGIAAVAGDKLMSIDLPIAGLMTDGDGYDVSDRYIELDKMVKDMGCGLNAPFMSLSFMALLVIPSIKLSDLGLFDGTAFEFI